MRSMHIYAALGAILAGFILLPLNSSAFNEGREDVAGDPEFQQILRERELERDRSRKNLEERERQRKDRQGKHRAHIHAPGDDPSSADGSQVVATIQLSKEEYENRDFSRVMAAARAHKTLPASSAAATAVSQTGGASKVPSPVATSNRTLLGLSLFLVAGGAWWFARPKESA